MKKILFLIAGLLALTVNAVAAPTDSELASRARKFLSLPENEAGFSVAYKCTLKKNKKTKKSENVCVSTLKDFDVVLAVKKVTDKEFSVVEVSGKGKNICASKTTGFKAACYVGSSGKTNGVNTEYEIEEPKGYKVYAIRRVVKSPKGHKEVVYTPYSDQLNTFEVRAVGRAYVDGVIKLAMIELRKQGVKSLVNKSELVADRVPADTISKLAAIEHIDEGRFMKEPFARLAGEMYAIYGLNQTIAYNYSVSTAKARGMFQIIPRTYDGLRKTYPHAGLDKNFFSGTVNHVNAAKAAILLADHDVGLLPTTLRQKLFDNLPRYEEYVGASYNGGPTRAKSILARGDDFVTHNKNKENRIYIMKIRSMQKTPVREMLASN